MELSSEKTSTSGQGVPHTHFLCVSPDAPTNPVLYWLGNFDSESTRFLLEGAKGPLRLDLGDILYAPNLMVDDQVGSSPPSLLPFASPCPQGHLSSGRFAVDFASLATMRTY